ncbi:hypothetical protein Q1695_012021 [Nippostrongylus brasiliensis]|nr:hypothetical protein Q1695_012021 [Nippostrongylus brasiliensis]
MIGGGGGDARNELLLSRIIDLGLVDCPESAIGCIYYPKRQCIDGKYGIMYTYTGCRWNNDSCSYLEIDEYSTMKLNGTIRCCRDLGCNIKAYNFLRSLPRWTPQHDFDESVSCEEAESTTKEHSSSNISTDSITVTHEAKGTITTDEQPSGTTITVNRDSN